MKLLTKIGRKRSILLGVILFLAFFLRVVDIGGNPPALYGDELTLSLDVNSILKTGYDQTGQFLPLYFKMSDGRPPAYVYFSMPFVALFGQSEVGVRLLSVFSGVGIVALIFLITRQLLGGQAALLAAGFMAVSPWDISMSRGGFETHFGLFLTLLGIWAFFAGLKRPWLLIISALGFGLAIHSYHSYKPLVPLVLLSLIWLVGFKKLLAKELRKCLVLSASVFLLLVLVWVWQIFAGSETRLLETNILSQQDLQAKITQDINSKRSASNLPEPLAALFHNKFISYSLLIGENYFNNFAPDFLFLHGDGNPRQNPATMGEFYLAQFVLVLLGGYYIFARSRRIFAMLAFWMVIAPLPAAIVADAHALRSAFLLPALTVFSGAGLYYLWLMAQKSSAAKIVLGAVALALFVQFLFFGERIYFLAPNLYGQFWSLPAKQAAILAASEKNSFAYVVISDRLDNIQYAYPVYAKVFPGNVISQNQRPLFIGNKIFRKYDNVLIGDVGAGGLNQILNNLSGPILYIGPADDLNKFPSASVTYDQSGLPMFISFEKHG